MEATRVFIHGLESSSRGAKGMFFRKRYPEMVVEDFSGSFTQRMEKLTTLLRGRSPLLLVGSSYGGLMAVAYAADHPEAVKKMILLAPALHLETERPLWRIRLPMPVEIFHGLQDTVVPLKAVRTLAEKIFSALTFHEVDDDHVLHRTFTALPWDELLALP